jgi:hypothetical protein
MVDPPAIAIDRMRIVIRRSGDKACTRIVFTMNHKL